MAWIRSNKKSAIPQEVLDLPTLKSATSGVISTFNTDLTNALNKLKISFSAVQDLSGGNPSPSNPCPITGFSQANVFRMGKNLFSGALNKGNYSNADFTLTATTSEIQRSFKIWLPSGTYTLSFNDTALPSQTFRIIRELIDGGYDTQAHGSINNYTFTTTKDGYVGFSFRKEDSSDWGNSVNVQLEIDNQATTYHAYHGNTYLLQFGDTYYGCEIDVVHGKLRVVSAYYIFTGSEAYGSLNNNRIYCTFLTDAYIPTEGTEKCVISSHYKGGTQNGYSSGEIYKSTGNVAIVFVDDVNGVDTTTFKTFLANQYANGTPVTAVYKLATPIEVDIDSAIITALTGEVNQVYCDIPTSEVEELQFFETIGRHIQ